MVNPLPSAEFLADFYNQAYYANPQWICSVDQDTVMRISAGKRGMPVPLVEKSPLKSAGQLRCGSANRPA